jgi:peptidoglycan/LPS O-acetylase OafA/YrhL/O-antigen ligase
MWRRGSTPPPGGWLTFALRRAARILPAYYLCLTVLVILTGRFASVGGLVDTALHYTLLFNYTEYSIYSIAASFWALALLAQLYVLFPLLVILLRVNAARRLPSLAMVLALTIAAYLAHAWVMRTALKVDPWPLPPWLIRPDGYVLSHSVLAHLPHFLLGIAMAWAYVAITQNTADSLVGRASRPSSTQRVESSLPIGRGRPLTGGTPVPPDTAGEHVSAGPAEGVFWLSLVAVLVILSTPLSDLLGLPYGRYTFPTVPLLIALMILAAPLSRGTRSLLELWPVRQLGVISFGIYIYHLPVLKAVNKMLVAVDTPASISPALLAVGGISLTVAVSVASYLFVEQPILRRTRSRRDEIVGDGRDVASEVEALNLIASQDAASRVDADEPPAPSPPLLKSPTIVANTIAPQGHPFAANRCTAGLIAVACVVGLLGVLSVTHAMPLPDWTGLAWRYPGTLRPDGSLDGVPVAPPPWAMAMWCAAFIAMAAGTWRPVAALCVYLAMFIMVPRYNTQAFYIMLDAGPLHWAATLAFAATCIHCVRRGTWPMIPRSLLTWLLVAFVGWIGIVTLSIPLRGLLWHPPHQYHPVLYLHALVMAGIAAAWMKPAAFWWMVCVVAGAVSVRAMIDPRAVWLDGDIAAYAAMALVMAMPGVLAASTSGRARSIVLPPLLILLGLNMAKVLVSSQNRGAAVGAALAIGVLWLMSRHKVKLALAGAPFAIAGGIAFFYSGLGGRFISALQGGSEANSASERVGIWRGAWAMIKDHPLMGVGPGHFSRHIQSYAPAVNSQIPAHNNFISILAETGVPGLLLYTALFIAAGASLWRLRSLMGRDTPGPESTAVLAGLTAYMGAGMFLTRDNLVLAYVLVGVTIALYASVFGAGRGDDEPLTIRDDATL